MKYLFNLLFDAPGDKTNSPTVIIPSSDGKSDEENLKDDLNLLGNEDDKDDDSSDNDEDEDEDKGGADKDGDSDDKDDEEREDTDKDDENKDKEDEEDEEDDLSEDKKAKGKQNKDDEEEQDLVRHSYSAIKKEFPELFKKFPGLKQAFFREQEFTKIFPTVDDAKAAVEAQENFNNVRDVVLSGNAETFLEQIKSASPDGLASFSTNFLTDLRKVDKDLYIDVTTPVIRGVLAQALQSGTHKKDENLIAAAKVIHQAIFGGEYDDINREDGRKTNREEDPERIKLNKDRAEFYEGKFKTLRTEIWTEVENTLTREIEKGLDPNNSIRPGLKKLLVEKIFDEVTKKVSSDKDHVSRMDALWMRERKAGYSGQLKDSLKTTYLSRAKAIIPAIRQRIRAEAVETQKSNDKNKSERVNRNNSDKRPDAGRAPNKGKTNITAKEANQKRMSDLDILNS